MQVVILCGGKGMRMRPQTEYVPKPMMAIGNAPILEHIMRYFSAFGHDEFILCLGYRKELIEEYFRGKPWNVKLVDTGENASKSERLAKVAHLLKEEFFVSYGDDLCTVDLNALLAYHKKTGALMTVTAPKMTSPYGILELEGGGKVFAFKEKPVLTHRINGGFLAMKKSALSFITPGEDLESGLMQRLASEGKLYAFPHNGFWASMNTPQDNIMLNELWNSGKAEWKIWKD